MKKIISVALIMLLWPAFSFADRYESSSRYWSGPSGHYRQPPPYARGNRGYYSHGYNGDSHHNDDWILPLAIFGTALGVMALSQQQYAPPPPPPQRMCRDTYNYVDQYGRYLYSEYVDRPCNY
ncbi:MAG: hypothetical protein NTY00_09260 [Deltaproteobacteria bacterium]|nr:hypothetical protein [Deltaproteobacteria bacterium]